MSYSQVANVPTDKKNASRAPASTHPANGYLGPAICVHLAHKLPDIEHVADLAHELTHATRLEMKVLRGEVENVDQFVDARLGAKGGEADAFSVECRVKRELIGSWDPLCSPYVSNDEIDVKAIVRDLYNGRLSASLTGESYPVMLSRQFNAIAAKRGLEKKSGLQ